MSDRLLELARNPVARRLVKALGLPLPIPTPLRRSFGPWDAEPLLDRLVVIGDTAGARCAGVVADAVVGIGARTAFVGSSGSSGVFERRGLAVGRPALQGGVVGDAPVDALVYDVSAARDVEGLVALYDFLHEWVPRVVLSGRIVMVACAADPGDVESAAVLAGLEGLTRSLAREVGRRGTTVQLVVVERGGEDPGSSAAVPVLRWLLSDRSAFVSGQTVRVPARELGVVPYLQPLAGRVAVVTGAARGIGSAVARALAREGARVIGVDLPDSLAGLRATMGAVGGTAVALDVTAPEAAARIRAALETYGGGLDLLVHDAAVTRDRTLVNLGRDDWNAVLQVNLAAPLALTRELLPAVRGGGRIVALSSIAGLGGNVGQTHYAATKAGLVGWAAALGPTLAARGITVNAVAPGIIETRMLDAMPPAVREVARRFNALSQAGLPEDVAEAILFLCTPGAAAVSGTCLRVCGLHLLGA